MRRAISCAALLVVLLVAAPSFAADGDTSAPPRIGVATWIGQDGKADTGPAYDLVALRSPRRPGCSWRLVAVLGRGTGGVALISDLYTEETRQGRLTVSLGGAAITSDPAAGRYKPAFLLTLRVSSPRRKEAP
jgi:hypothetical protein